MRKLKLQMNFAGIDWDSDMVDFCIENLKGVDSILLGRKTAEGFIPYWAEVAKNPDPDDINSRLGRPLTEIPRTVFSNTLAGSQWDNATIVRGNLAEAIKNLKENEGQDIIVYGGNSFVSSLVGHKLIDEYYLFLNPLAVRSDDPILKFINAGLPVTLQKCKSFSCGTVLVHYTKQE
jgi:dihydrofolate reductase